MEDASKEEKGDASKEEMGDASKEELFWRKQMGEPDGRGAIKGQCLQMSAAISFKARHISRVRGMRRFSCGQGARIMKRPSAQAS